MYSEIASNKRRSVILIAGLGTFGPSLGGNLPGLGSA
jgi:hypothetical protein